MPNQQEQQSNVNNSDNQKNKLQPLHTNVVFQFKDEVRKGMFNNTTSSGLVVDMGKEYLQYGALCRRVTVKAVGESCKNILVDNDYIVENLKWTNSFIHNGERYWMTTEKHILGLIVSKTPI